jgi:hypothetical protein
MQKPGRLAFVVAAGLIVSGLGGAQTTENRDAFVRRKLAALEQFASANQARLRKYTWTETVRYILNLELRTTRRFRCRYASDGSIERTPAGPPAAEPTDGPFRPSAREGTPEELEIFLAKIRAAVALYVPPDTAMLEKAFQAGNVRVDRRAQGEALLLIHSYARPDDAMALDFRTDQKRLVSLKVDSYLDSPSDRFALDARFAALPDGTNYPENVELTASGKAVRVMITNGDYRPLP